MPSMIDWEHPLVGHATDNGFDIFRGLAVTINLPPYVYVKEDRIQYYDPALGAYRDARNTDAYQNFTTDQLDGDLPAGRDSAAGLGDPSYKQIDQDPIMLGEVESYLGQRATNPAPFFAYVCMYSPHEPWHVTPPFNGAVGFPYGDWMADFDSRIGRILSAIDDNGLRDNTLVILTSDNGPEIAAFINSRANGRDSNGPLRGVKHDVWEGGTRVPFLVRWPGQITAPGTVTNELIWQGDIFATVAAYLGADLPANVAPDGESFLNILRGQSKPSQRRDSIVISSQYDHRAVIRTDGWKLIDSTGGGGHQPVVRFSQRRHRQCRRRQSRHARSSSSICRPISGKTRNAIAGITDVTAIRSALVVTTGRDLLDGSISTGRRPPGRCSRGDGFSLSSGPCLACLGTEQPVRIDRGRGWLRRARDARTDRDPRLGADAYARPGGGHVHQQRLSRQQQRPEPVDLHRPQRPGRRDARADPVRLAGGLAGRVTVSRVRLTMTTRGLSLTGERRLRRRRWRRCARSARAGPRAPASAKP
jgi:hypothetical protein